MLIGIMQGRLSPPESDRYQAFPRTHWQEECTLAEEAGLQSIEWLYDLYGADVNPIATDTGIVAMKSRSVQVLSLCAHYFIDRPALDPAKLIWLLDRCYRAGIKRIVLPFVDASRIVSPEPVIAMLKEVLPQTKVEIDLETSLEPKAFADLLSAVPHPLLKVNYDSGNSAALGYSPTEEFAAYGERIGGIHIKDRVRNGGTVPLGTGDADFPAFFAALKEIHYQGDFIMEVARETPGDELALAKRNLAWLRSRI